ncbi:DUF4367 domain-containing protein [Natranaerofaba carboxydovora]|uniref:DUF4367 domain-containing protein n=1 Tax=Natranaerofaba carboxydovora TaxID=2742683 RepID=UPI001F13319C|nr:DUF4367 domain-containing protein [Natranaerofaba carboxydovora]UMZ74411.1 hypothetical protein ACONDI_02002 [Natranaerofaba carboxydovora]
MNEHFEKEKWDKLLMDIEEHRGKKRLKKVGKSISFVILGLIFINFSVGAFFTSPSEALRSVVLDISREEDGHYVQYNWLPEEKLDEIELELKDEGVYLPEYLPPGYELDEFDISPEVYNAHITFKNDEDLLLRLTQRELSENEERASAYPNAEEIDEDVEIDGYEGMIVYHKNDYITVLFIDHKLIEHSITGKLAKEEIINIAESIH